jgi:hypothetical protein
MTKLIGTFHDSANMPEQIHTHISLSDNRQDSSPICKSKAGLVHAMKAYRGSRSITPLILNLA